MGKLSHEEIADGTGLPLEEVKALEEEIMHLVWFVQTEMECRGATMCKMLEDMRNEAAKESVRKTAKRLLKMEKLSHEEIADGIGLPLEEVKALEEEIMQLA